MTEVIYEGIAFRVEQISTGRDTDVASVLQATRPSDADRAVRLIRSVGDYGPPRNIQKCRDLGDGLFELKAYQLRIVFFYDGPGRIVCTHAFTKKQDRTPRREITRAKELRAAYLEAAEAGS